MIRIHVVMSQSPLYVQLMVPLSPVIMIHVANAVLPSLSTAEREFQMRIVAVQVGFSNCMIMILLESSCTCM